jgi:hypothetical protein
MAIVATLVVWASGGDARPDMIVTPPALRDGGGGNSDNIAPFDPLLGVPTRMQQVFASSNFDGMGGPRYIDSISFRSNPFGATLEGFTITMSTTDKAVDGLSPVFADNTGADAQSVYQEKLPIYSLPPATSSVADSFGLVINLQHPFLYDPSKGNLLVDYTNASPEKTVFVNNWRPVLDAEDVLGDSTSRVLGYLGPASVSNPYSVGDLGHGNPDTLGLVAAFVTGGPDPIPQPAIPTLTPEPPSIIAMALVALIAFRGRPGRRGPCNTVAPSAL